MPDKTRTVGRADMLGGASMGPATDATNRPVVDPTANVLSLVSAEAQRQDDLRLAQKELTDAKLAHLKEIGNIRSKNSKALAKMEKGRLDSIRQVDREDVNKTALAAQTAIATLASTAATTAETLRTQVATTAAAQLATFQTAMGEVNKRLSALELSSSEGKGKQAVSDPALVALTDEVRHLAQAQDERVGKQAVSDPIMITMLTDMKTLLMREAQETGKGVGINWLGATIAGGAVLMFGFITMALAVYAAFKPH